MSICAKSMTSLCHKLLKHQNFVHYVSIYQLTVKLHWVVCCPCHLWQWVAYSTLYKIAGVTERREKRANTWHGVTTGAASPAVVHKWADNGFLAWQTYILNLWRVDVKHTGSSKGDYIWAIWEPKRKKRRHHKIWTKQLNIKHILFTI